MDIKDRDARNAVETIIDEFGNLEQQVETLTSEKEELEQQVSDLKNQVEEYEGRIKELEEALAESYLTSEVPDEQDICDTGHSW